MAKKLTAVTNIKHNGEEFTAGDTLDLTKFSQQQLKALYDVGAVKVEEVPDTPDTSAPEEPAVANPEEG